MGRRSATLVIALAVVASSCSDDSPRQVSDRPTTTEARSTTTAATTTTGLELFAGSVDDFYVLPVPLPSGRPGELIRTQPHPADRADPAGATSTRIMYHSVDSAGRDRAVTGTVTVPAGEAPEGGWPVLTVAPGTVGLASSCAQSRLGVPVFDPGLPVVRVMTDYIGMGPVGETMPYLSRASEGHSVLDAARAARHLVGDDASAELAIFGHSQGGHGAQSAHELAADYAPELDVVGTVSVAPAAMFDRTYGGVDDIVSRIVSTMSIYGLATEQPGIDPASYLSPEAAAAMAAVKDSACLDAVIEALVPFAAAAPYWAVDPFATEPARSILAANDVGNVATPAPLLLIGGTADERVVEERVRDLFARLCATGQRTGFVMLDGANHGTEVPRATPQIADWFRARLAGEPAVDDCP